LDASTQTEWLTLLAVAGSAAVMFLLVRRLMRGMNQQDFILLRQTRQRGIDVTQPRRVDFIVFAATAETAAELAQLMRDDGFETSMTQAQVAYARNKKKPGEAQDGMLIKGTRTVALTPENLKRQREFLNGIALPRKAAYFGWQVGFGKDAASIEQGS
jgi:hypothetical protein